jgi:hypothetical protein
MIVPAKVVDVFDNRNKLLNSYEVVLNGLNYEPQDREFSELARDMAVDDRLVSPDLAPALVFRVRSSAH